ncbi:MAG TPA: UDP-N-acetyl-D-mannosamine dehydrogenase [Humibacillus xanthopallidus]|nr:UDP-N-acetyl-D-mannosamine dehydrogenase [Humibacillus xanthopallidus]
MFDDGIAVIGLGYIGLPTCAALTGRGLRVVGVDVNARTVAEINAGRVPIVEPNLDEAILEAVERGLLTATTEMPHASVYLIAVPTPFRGDHEPDLRHVRAATEAIAPQLRGGEVVILESTSPPGTTERISEWISDLRPDLKLPHMGGIPDVHLAHCPERVLPGRIMVEIFTNDRVVGGLTPECAERAAELYRTFVAGEIVLTDATSAEMAKLTENAFRDVNIAFANELAEICDHLGVDVWEVISMANHHPRVNILQPGPGVGGHCIAVDPWFIVSAAPEQARLIRAARETNDARPRTVLTKVAEAVAASGHGGSLSDSGGDSGSAGAGEGVTIACLGLAFKADIDDLRESPALAITETLAAEHPDARILAVEPHVSRLPATLAALPNVELVSTQEALREAQVVVLLVDHAAFRAISLGELHGRQLVDTRGIWRREAVAR